MRAYEMRPDGVTARVDDSAEDSMKHRSFAEEEGEMGGRAHRRSRIPRFRPVSNEAMVRATASRQPVFVREAVTSGGPNRAPPALAARSYLTSTLAPCSSSLDLILSAS